MDRLIEQLLKNKSFPLKSQGSSMLPILCSDDVVYFKKVYFKNLQVNDLVLVKKKHQLFTHRVIYKTNKYLVTKGDNNPQSDGKIYSHQIIGKVTKVKRNGKEFDPNQIYLLQSSLYFQEIIKIKSLFEKGKIDFVFLKGLPLHLYFEKTHPQRVYVDCDVLIKKIDFTKAEVILLKFGYKKISSSFSKTQQLNDKKTELSYYKIFNGFSVVFDLHLEVVFLMTQLGKLEALYQQKDIDSLTNECLKTKKQVMIGGEKIFFLNSKFLIPYLALHFFHHNFRGAFRLDFLDKIIKKSRLKEKDWLEIAQITNKYQLGNFVYPVFVLLRKYYNAPLSGSFRVTMKQLNNETISRYLKVNIFDDEPRIGAGINRFKNIFFLSPYPWWKKIFVFINPLVIYFIFWSLKKKLSSFFSTRRVNPASLS